MFELFLLVLAFFVRDYCGFYIGLTSLIWCSCWLNIQCIPLERGVGRNTRCGGYLDNDHDEPGQHENIDPV